MRFRWSKHKPEEKDAADPFQPEGGFAAETGETELPALEMTPIEPVWEVPPTEPEPDIVFETPANVPDAPPPDAPDWNAHPEPENIPVENSARIPDNVEPETAATPAPKKKIQWPKNLSIGRLLRGGLLFFALLILIRNCHGDIPTETLKQRYTYADSRFVKVCGMDVHCRISGKGQPLLLLHDNYSSLRSWNAWHEGLSDRYKVISVDLPGFGLTGPHPIGSYSAFMYKGFVDSLALALDLRQFNLAGNGLGGQIAWFYASEYPDRLEHLILIDAAGFEKSDADTWIYWLAKIPVLNRSLLHITPREYIRLMLQDVYADDSAVTDSLVKEHFELMLRPGNRKALLDRALVKDNWPPVGIIDTINIPTFILWGAEDARISPKDAYNFHGKIRSSVLRIYQHTGHWPQQENPAQTVREVGLFLEGKF